MKATLTHTVNYFLLTAFLPHFGFLSSRFVHKEYYLPSSKQGSNVITLLILPLVEGYGLTRLLLLIIHSVDSVALPQRVIAGD